MHDNYQLVVHGVDGSKWPIHGRGEHPQVRLLEGALGDFYDAPLATAHKARVGQPGSSFLGARDLERHVVLRVGFFDTDWQRWESRFRRAFSPTADATLVVRTEQSGERHLRVRLEEHPQFEDGLDPFSQGIMVKKFVLIAHNPYWVDPVIYTDTFTFDGSNWFSGSVTVNNPTDVPVWPKWTLTSPAKFGLGDIPIGQSHDQDRVVWIPFQATGSTALVDTDPIQELITSNGEPLWELMNGQFFMHQIPPFTPDTKIPVRVDPFPLIPVIIDPAVRTWIAQKLEQLVGTMGLRNFLALTPEEIGRRVSEWMQGVRPDWVPELTSKQISEFTGEAIAKILRETYGRITNIAGAEAQIHLERRWRHPWG
ncbi:hypothetical protein [Corynebacterium lactis]|uniref:Minor tail protein n=1 Tax=Corynebacterium lactis RW2-5 TaxID=1408189 RepID=A0A0K2H3D8_9CORY|nr:hypothetical protein [Corynebacterium lactis]ALA68547.1 hypothetical protein CLAC_07280 [Corynebacterium lactis RW2-5]